jgi:hypothetical protein
MRTENPWNAMTYVYMSHTSAVIFVKHVLWNTGTRQTLNHRTLTPKNKPEDPRISRGIYKHQVMKSRGSVHVVH